MVVGEAVQRREGRGEGRSVDALASNERCMESPTLLIPHLTKYISTLRGEYLLPARLTQPESPLRPLAQSLFYSSSSYIPHPLSAGTTSIPTLHTKELEEFKKGEPRRNDS